MKHLRTICRPPALLAIAVLLACACGGPALASTGDAAEAEEASFERLPQTTMGVEGVFFARHAGPVLEAAPYDENAPIVLRIAEVSEEKGRGENVLIYELRYIGTQPGVFDLREYLVRRDGEPLAGLAPLEVEVLELLPADHNGELAVYEEAALPTAWPYTFILRLFAVAWVLPIAWVVLELFRKRRREKPAPAVAEPTLADQLRPLVQAALAGEMSREEKARLEMLLLGYWRERLELDGLPMNESLARMREDEQAGELLRELEAWLHQPPGRVEVDVTRLLAPYQQAAPQRVKAVPPALRPQTAEVAP